MDRRRKGGSGRLREFPQDLVGGLVPFLASQRGRELECGSFVIRCNLEGSRDVEEGSVAFDDARCGFEPCFARALGGDWRLAPSGDAR